MGLAVVAVGRVSSASVATARTTQRLESGLERVQQCLVAERFAQECSGARAKRLLARRLIAMGSDENDRDAGAGAGQPPLQLEAGHSGHAHVDDQTSDLGKTSRIQQLLRGRKDVDFEASGPQETLERLTYRLIVIDDGDRPASRGTGCLRFIADH